MLDGRKYDYYSYGIVRTDKTVQQVYDYLTQHVPMLRHDPAEPYAGDNISVEVELIASGARPPPDDRGLHEDGHLQPRRRRRPSGPEVAREVLAVRRAEGVLLGLRRRRGPAEHRGRVRDGACADRNFLKLSQEL